MKMNTKIIQRTDAILIRLQERFMKSLSWQYEVTTDPFEGQTGYLYRINFNGRCLHLFLTDDSYKNLTPELIMYALLGKEGTDDEI